MVGPTSVARAASSFFGTLLAFAVFSCGAESDERRSNGAGGSGGSGGSSISSTDYPRRFAETHCETIGSCCNRESFAFDQATCTETLEGLIRTGFASVLENPNIAFDGAAAARCLEAYWAALAACDDRDLAQRIDQPCEEVFPGTVPEGGQCEDDDECAQGSTGTVLCDEDGVCRRAEDEIAPGGSSRAGLVAGENEYELVYVNGELTYGYSNTYPDSTCSVGSRGAPGDCESCDFCPGNLGGAGGVGGAVAEACDFLSDGRIALPR